MNEKNVIKINKSNKINKSKINKAKKNKETSLQNGQFNLVRN